MAEVEGLGLVNYETGNTSQWSGSNILGSNTFTAASDAAIHGIYGGKITFAGSSNGAYYYKSLSSNQAKLYVRKYIRFDTIVNPSTASYIIPLVIRTGTTVLAQVIVGVSTSGIITLYRMSYQNGSGLTHVVPTSLTFSVDTDYYIELMWDYNSGSNNIELKINGTTYATVSSVSQTTYQYATRADGGIQPFSGGFLGSGTIIFDDDFKMHNASWVGMYTDSLADATVLFNGAEPILTRQFLNMASFVLFGGAIPIAVNEYEDRIVTIASTGADYTSLSAALAGESDFQDGERHIVFEITGAFVESNSILITADQFSTSAEHRVIIRTNDANRAGTTFDNTKYYLTYNSWEFLLRVQLAYCTVDGLQFLRGSSVQGVSLDNTRIIFKDCLFQNLGLDFGEYEYNIAVNCISLNSKFNGFSLQNANSNTYLYYCTSLNAASYGFRFNLYNTVYAHNCYAGNSGTSDYYNFSLGSIDYCVSSDGSQSTTQVSVANCNFVNSTAGSEDVTLQASSDLYGIGTDLSEDSVYPVTTDIFGTERASVPCIGAFELLDNGEPEDLVYPHSIIYVYRMMMAI